MTKQEKLDARAKLISFASDIGYKVELDAKMQDHIDEAREDEDYDECFNEAGEMIKEVRPAGDCNYNNNRIRVREGKSLTGQVTTLIHELTHALGLGGASYFSWLGTPYIELAAESVTEYMTQALGINRTEKTARRVFGYGFRGFLASPTTQTIVNVLAEVLDVEPFEIHTKTFEFKVAEVA